MSVNEFLEGTLVYTAAGGITPADLAHKLAGAWQDGYVAFAASEKRLAELKGIAPDVSFLSGRVQNLDGAEGYVTELNLWRRDGAILEEIAAEREENTFHVQTWRLDTAPATGSGNCWHRPAATRSGSHHKAGRRLFSGELAGVEVVMPQQRLNFYITRGE